MVNYKDFYKVIDLIRRDEDLSIEEIGRYLRLSEEEAAKVIQSVISMEPYSIEDAVDILEDMGYKTSLSVIDFKFAQFMMVESTIQNSKAPEVIAENILTAIIRPIDEDLILDSNTIRIKKELNEMSMEYLAPVLEEFYKNRDHFHNTQFSGVFYKKDDPNKDEDAEEPEQSPEDKERARVDKNYHLYNMMDKLAGEDVTKHEQIMQMSMSLIAPKIAKDMAYERLEYKRMARENAKNRARRR